MNEISIFLSGAISLASLVVALFFFRFWRSTHDMFFMYFALSFALECASRALAVGLQVPDSNPIFYGVRVISYGLIIIAIWQKNRR
ncbi:MAG TPA: DUF5985 family protein [Ramlibacter sp.]|jgi:hypothetical protein|nr:DUF5985 family protein [Ramlibacter sp.]